MENSTSLNASEPCPPTPQQGDAESMFILSRCAILIGICNFIPLPFVDDFIAERVRKHLVASLLQRHQRTDSASSFRPLYREDSSCVGIVVGFVRNLIFKPIKKLLRLIFFFLAIRAAALAMTRVFLQGRAIDLCLRNRTLTTETDARRISAAFAKAFRGTDWKFLAHLMRQTGRGLRPIRFHGQRLLRRIFGQSKEPRPDDELSSDQLDRLSPEERARLNQEAERLAEALNQEEVLGFLEQFDQRFLDCLREGANR